jgi:hypothetical protein
MEALRDSTTNRTASSYQGITFFTAVTTPTPTEFATGHVTGVFGESGDFLDVAGMSGTLQKFNHFMHILIGDEGTVCPHG